MDLSAIVENAISKALETKNKSERIERLENKIIALNADIKRLSVKNAERKWCVVDDKGNLAGHDMSKTHAKMLEAEMKEKEPNKGWEAIEQDI